MKIAIDISPLKNANQFRGVGVYTDKLVGALRQMGQNDFAVDLISAGRQVPRDCDLVHYPYFDLFFLTLPLLKPKPAVVTVHDTIPLVFPEYFPSGIKGGLKFRVQKFSLRGAAAVITDCRCSKRDIQKYLGFPESRTFVVPLAPGKEFKKLEIGNWKLEIKQKYHLPDTFVLYVGDVNYHKNIPGLIRAFQRYTSEESKPTSEVKLVLVGKAFQDEALNETRQLVQLIKSLNLEARVRRLGWVSQEDLPAIYNLAAVYCQPSFYEGFGLPVLEAMACGTPVVCADTASLQEIAAGAAVMVDPHDINSIARGVKEAIANRNELVRKGLIRAKRFTWEKTARETFRVYQRVFKKCRRS